MTESEAMIRLDFIRCALLGGTKPEIISNEDNVELMDNAIKALEDVQQYRAIGTPEEIKQKLEELEAEIKEYKAIGDFAELIEKWCWKHQYHNQDDLNELMEIAEQLKGGGVDE